MKITASVLLVVFLFLCGQGFGQVITLSKRKASLELIFNEINKQTGYNFFYRDEWLKHARKVDIDVKDEPVLNVLELCLRNQPFAYKIAGKTIVLNRKSGNADSVPDGEIVSIQSVSGIIQNEKGEFLEGVTVIAENGRYATSTNIAGAFNLKDVPPNSTLIITGANIEPFEIKLEGRKTLALTVRTKISTIEEVVVSTGYQEIPKERVTGSYTKINNEMYNRKTGPQVLDRLNGITNGLLFDKRKYPVNLQIRGLFTLTESISQPLIVVDNFPYEGNINNLNANDIESVTILKDASATSIWGARAGNGVIVITTKKGSFNQPLSISATSSVMIYKKTDLHKIPDISSSDYVDLEKQLFNLGVFNDLITDKLQPLTPVMDILNQQKKGLLTSGQADMQLNALRNNDVRNDFENYLYKKEIIQQNSVAINGGGKKAKYFFSVGYNKDREGLAGNDNSRFNVRSDNTFIPFKKLQVRLSAGYTHSSSDFNSPPEYKNTLVGRRIIPLYSRLIDEKGQPAVIDAYFKREYTDTVGGGKLLDWKYRPLKQLEVADNSLATHALTAEVNLKYNITSTLNGEIKYQYQHSEDITVNNYNTDNIRAIDLINNYSQIINGSVKYNIPNGPILDKSTAYLNNHALRGQLNFNKSWNDKHTLSVMGGSEIRDLSTNILQTRSYSGPVDYLTAFPQYSTGALFKIPETLSIPNESVTRFVSWYGNTSYTFLDRYVFTASARKDASNIFGVSSNNNAIPLWSTGAAWKISNEKFYSSNLVPYLNLRFSYGFSGNVNNSMSALTIIRNGPSPAAYSNLPYATITNIPNSELRWEKVRQMNLGFDINSRNNRIKANIDFFTKRSTDVLGFKQLDPTVGRNTLRTNSASIKGSGIDLQLTTLNIEGPTFRWSSLINFNRATYNVSSFLFNDDNSGYTSEGNEITPIVGYNPYLIVSYKWAGLDPVNGDPRGYFNGQISKDYDLMVDSIPFSGQLISGTALPKYFGNITNILSWKGLSCSFNIIYKLNYFFRRPTVNYSRIVNNGYVHPDYLKRWKKPGDENYTSVPSAVFPVVDINKYLFYENSEVTVERADHIRLNDIRLSYNLGQSPFKKMPFKDVQFYIYMSDLNIILWKENKVGIDPDFPLGLPALGSVTAGFKINL